MTRQFPADSASFPVYALAETHGISRRYAMILRDVILDVYGDPIPEGIRFGSYWHTWAIDHATEDHGIVAVGNFLTAVTDRLCPDGPRIPRPYQAGGAG